MSARDGRRADWRDTTPRDGAPLMSSEPASSTTLERVLIVLIALTGSALVMRLILGA